MKIITVNSCSFYLLFSAFINMNCSGSKRNKDNSTDFTGKNWKLVTLSVKPAVDWDLDGKLDTDILKFVDECERDDLKHFKADHSMIQYPGNIKCDEDDPQPVTGSWAYDANQQTLTLNEQDTITTYKLMNVTPDRLTLLYDFEKTNGEAHQMTAVYEVIP